MVMAADGVREKERDVGRTRPVPAMFAGAVKEAVVASAPLSIFRGGPGGARNYYYVPAMGPQTVRANGEDSWTVNVFDVISSVSAGGSKRRPDWLEAEVQDVVAGVLTIGDKMGHRAAEVMAAGGIRAHLSPAEI